MSKQGDEVVKRIKTEYDEAKRKQQEEQQRKFLESKHRERLKEAEDNK